MKKLIFNNQEVIYILKESEFYVAIKPVCQALNIKYVHQFETIKADAILGAAFRKYGTQVGGQKREMVFLPEKLIYGWLFQIKSKSPEFLEYKNKCYEVLYNFFSGQLINRKKLLTLKAEIINKKNKIVISLSDNPKFLEYLDLEKQHRAITFKMNKIDNEEIKENLSLFDQLN
ncbi:MAG TPA: hypothetical protein DDZ41_11905 [Flavobacterium sp.]|nr:hypothetical protein [Flavobacterium sp.]